ncbi:MAG TPA: hypothetical protein VKF14_14475 [Candidatus Dormibacteraeota bacterium]|nr:hypothetical protein [Candidatus Dormibacteraeota bacterium]
MTVAAAPTSSCPGRRSASPEAAFRQARNAAHRRGRDESDLVFGKASERQLGLPASTADAGADTDGMQRTEVVSRAAINVRLQLYQAERRHLVKVSAQAVGCGIEERRLRLAESQGAMVTEVVRRVFDDPRFGLDAAQRELGRLPAASHMRMLRSSAVEPV